MKNQTIKNLNIGKRFTLNKKLVIATLSGVLVSSSIFIVIFSILYQYQLHVERENTVNTINSIFHSSLKKSMLNQQKNKLNKIMGNLVELNPNLVSVSVLSNKGIVVFSSQLNTIGNKVDYDIYSASDSYKIISKNNNTNILRKLNPVNTEKGCTKCHKSIDEQPIRGYIMIDYDVSIVRHKVFKTSLLLMGSGAIIVLINIVGGLWFIRRFIVKPIDKISLASRDFSAGNLDTRVTLKSNDELSDLADSFNAMAKNLTNKIQQLKTSKLFLQNLIDAFPDGICVINKDFDVILSNKTYKNTHKVNSINNKCYATNFQNNDPCAPSFISCPVYKILKGNESVKTIQKHKDKNGKLYYAEVNAMPMYIEKNGIKETFIIESIRDINAQISDSHENRLEEFGMLSCGVAHEILNPLSTVKFALSSCVKICDNKKIDSNYLLENLQVIEKEIQICIEVTNRLLKLGTKPNTKSEIVFIKNAILETLSLLQWEAQENNINITHQFEDEDELVILGADSDLRIIALNMAHNAFHAMPNGGEIVVKMKLIDDFIEIIFEDNGIGINPEDIQKIFHPFYSKRADLSKGLGLGIPICRNIVKKYNGTLTVNSTPQKGTIFTILLPKNKPK